LKKSDIKPFLGAIAIYVLAFAGLAYSLFPYVIIDRMTIWQAAAHESSLKFVLVGALLVLPFLVAYTFYVYRVFGGKTKDGGAY
jgi:cytochrome d ubiquinol oxidase subunit II